MAISLAMAAKYHAGFSRISELPKSAIGCMDFSDKVVLPDPVRVQVSSHSPSFTWAEIVALILFSRGHIAESDFPSQPGI